MFSCLQAVQNSPSPDTSRTEEMSGSSGAVLSSLSIFCFLFLFYQLCVLFILLINLICQIAYLVISFIATVCDSRQFSGNSDVTMKLFKTRRNLVMVKKLDQKEQKSRVISNDGFRLISLCILQSRTLQAYRNEKQRRSRIWSRSSWPRRSKIFLSISKILKSLCFEKSKKGKL